MDMSANTSSGWGPLVPLDSFKGMLGGTAVQPQGPSQWDIFQFLMGLPQERLNLLFPDLAGKPGLWGTLTSPKVLMPLLLLSGVGANLFAGLAASKAKKKAAKEAKKALEEMKQQIKSEVDRQITAGKSRAMQRVVDRGLYRTSAATAIERGWEAERARMLSDAFSKLATQEYSIASQAEDATPALFFARAVEDLIKFPLLKAAYGKWNEPLITGGPGYKPAKYGDVMRDIFGRITASPKGKK